MKKMKTLVGLSVLALVCSATATIFSVKSVETKADTPTGVFEVADGASIRTGDPIGIRFVVKMSADVKETIVKGNYKFGFVASREDYFDNVVNGDYVNMTNGLTKESEAITSDNVGDYFYEGEGIYDGYWCANVVINMGESDTVDKFVKRTYSAVAYYTDGTVYTYAENRQERSVQTVASRAYLSSNPNWDRVKEVYPNIGGETVPLLVEQDGNNSYNNLLDKCDEDGAEYYFALTENIIAETDLSTDATTSFKGNLNTNGFTVNSPKGYILDGADAQDIKVSTGFDDYSATISFDETKKYDSQSNGSYKIVANTVGTLAEANRTLEFSIKPTYRSTYYRNLKNNGYEYIAIRYMMESYECSGTTRFDYASSSEKYDMDIYYDGKKIVDKTDTYTFWGNSNLKQVPVGSWAEMLLDIDKFIATYNNEEMNLFQLVVNKDSSWNMTMYIDNIYAVKGEANATTDTKIVEKASEMDLSTLATEFNMSNAVASITLDGETVSASDNKLKIDKYGVYSIDLKDRAMYGSITQEVMAQGTVISYMAENFSAKHIINATSVATDYVAVKADGEIMVSSGGAGKVSGVSMTTYSVKTVGDQTYYESLQKAGYEYITYEYTLSFTGSASSMIYRYGFVTVDGKHTNNMGSYSFSYKVLASGETTDKIYDTSTKSSNTGFQSTSYPDTWNGKTFIVSIPIQTVIDNYTSTMRILAFYFNAAATELDYNVTFGNICATKSACVIE